jgi:hypothetical protein
MSGAPKIHSTTRQSAQIVITAMAKCSIEMTSMTEASRRVP